MRILARTAWCAVLALVIAACGDDDAATTTTTAATTTTTSAAETTTTVEETTTTVAPATTTTIGTGLLVDPFDGSTPAMPYFDQTHMSWDLSTMGFLTISNVQHSSTGVGISYFATYNHFFRDGIITMRFRPGASGAVQYSMFFWATADSSNYLEVGVSPDGVAVIGVSPGSPNTATYLGFDPSLYDPTGFNELKVQAFDGVIEVFLNGESVGEVIDPVPLHEGLVGFSLVANDVGAEMTLDEFTIQPEVS